MAILTPKDRVRAALIAIVSLCVLMGMFLTLAMHRLALQDYLWVALYLLPLLVMSPAVALRWREILRMIS